MDGTTKRAGDYSQTKSPLVADPSPIRLFAKGKYGTEEITDFYWFEEHGVHWFDGEGHFDKYEIELLADEYRIPLTALLKKWIETHL